MVELVNQVLIITRSVSFGTHITRGQTNKHTHTHTPAHAHSHKHTHTQTHTHMHTHTRTRTHTHTHTQVRDRLPHLKVIIQYSPEPVDPAQRDQGVIPWDEFMEIGKVTSCCLHVRVTCVDVALCISYEYHYNNCCDAIAPM